MLMPFSETELSAWLSNASSYEALGPADPLSNARKRALPVEIDDAAIERMQSWVRVNGERDENTTTATWVVMKFT